MYCTFAMIQDHPILNLLKTARGRVRRVGHGRKPLETCLTQTQASTRIRARVRPTTLRHCGRRMCLLGGAHALVVGHTTIVHHGCVGQTSVHSPCGLGTSGLTPRETLFWSQPRTQRLGGSGRGRGGLLLIGDCPTGPAARRHQTVAVCHTVVHHVVGRSGRRGRVRARWPRRIPCGPEAFLCSRLVGCSFHSSCSSPRAEGGC
jgi:hypothetical protein